MKCGEQEIYEKINGEYHLFSKIILHKCGISLQVQDKSYFLGLLRTRIAELGTEMGRLGSEIELMKQEQSTFLTYDKRVKEMAQELTGKLIYAAFGVHVKDFIILIP